MPFYDLILWYNVLIMTVTDIMHKRIITVDPDDQISEVARIIFNAGISGVPVVKKGKLLGIVTEEDLLRSMFPTLQDVLESSPGARNFQTMEEQLGIIIHQSVKTIMNTRVTTISPDTKIMRAESIMLLNGFSRLPVVNEDNNLIGIISQGDIFKYLIRQELPEIEQAKYATFIADNYGEMVNWQKRLDFEFPELFKLFKKYNVQKLIDLGSWTGEYACALAKEGYQVLGLDNSELMIKICNENREELSPAQKENINFSIVNYHDLGNAVKETYDAVICMGNSLPYIPVESDQLFSDIKKHLKREGLFFMQVLNFKRVLSKKNRLLSFNIRKSDTQGIKETLNIEFINEASSKWVDHHVAGFDFDGKNWIFNGMTSISVQHLEEEDIKKDLESAGYRKIQTSGNTGEYQGDYGPLSLDTPYNNKTHDWFNVVAIK